MLRSVRSAAAGLVGLTFVFAACGSSKTTAPTNSSGVNGATNSATNTTGAGAPNPNAKEALPPGDIPDNAVYVPYTPAAGGYTISYPQGWAKRETATGTTLSQYFNRIDLVVTKSATAPSVASARSVEAAALNTVPGFKLISIESVQRTAGSAVRIIYAATSAIDPVTAKTVTLEVERYLLWHSGTLLTVTLSSAKGSDNVDPWKTVTNSLVWK